MGDSVTMGGHERVLMATRTYRLVTARLIAPWALQGTRPRGDVLEIGGGVGAMAHHLLSVTPDLRLVETDFDPEMCAIASRNLGRFGTRAAVKQADANHLPFGDHTFDFVLSFLMLHHTGDWRSTLREAIRVLRPGGRLVGFDLVAGAPLHHPERASTLIQRGELAEFLPTLAVTDVRVRPGLAKMLVRFVATKR
jgi:ubiquinone/menaquinone biosynthesis C-methylase UbiE